MTEFDMAEDTAPLILLVGVGGCGCSAIEVIKGSPLAKSVTLAAINTDHRELSLTGIAKQIAIGKRLTNGLGAGANPAIATESALQNRDAFIELITGFDLVLLIAGGGGGTGTGASPVLLSVCQELNIPSIAFVVKPFAFEGAKRRRFAAELVMNCRERAGATIVFDNDALLPTLGKHVKLEQALDAANQHINDLLSGLIAMMDSDAIARVDFSHLIGLLSQHQLGTGGVVEGNTYADLKDKLLHFPLLSHAETERYSNLEEQKARCLGSEEQTEQAPQVLYHIWAPTTFSLSDFEQIGDDLSAHFHHQAELTAGLTLWGETGIKIVVFVVR